jgi:hypothetical protein
LERNQVPLCAEITCRFRPKSGAGLFRFLQLVRREMQDDRSPLQEFRVQRIDIKFITGARHMPC